MTKWEVKEYLTKIYNLPVKNVSIIAQLLRTAHPTNSRSYCFQSLDPRVLLMSITDRGLTSLLHYHVAATQLYS